MLLFVSGNWCQCSSDGADARQTMSPSRYTARDPGGGSRVCRARPPERNSRSASDLARIKKGGLTDQTIRDNRRRQELLETGVGFRQRARAARVPASSGSEKVYAFFAVPQSVKERLQEPMHAMINSCEHHEAFRIDP